MSAASPLTPEAWFARLAEVLAAEGVAAEGVAAEGVAAEGVAVQGGGAQGSAIATSETTVDEATRAALLDLARIAAHTSERWAAPVSTWLVGLALADATPDERLARLTRVVRTLEGRALEG